jgi:hypothetical protein
MLKKLTSRKFWITLLVAIGGAATALSGVGGTVGLVAGIVVAALSAISYVVVEGRIDAKSVDLTADAIKKIISLIDEHNKEKESKNNILVNTPNGSITSSTIDTTKSK